MEITYLLPHHRIGSVGVGVADVQPPPAQHRHIVLVLVVVVTATAMRPPHPPVTPGRDGAGGSAEKGKGQ